MLVRVALGRQIKERQAGWIRPNLGASFVNFEVESDSCARRAVMHGHRPEGDDGLGDSDLAVLHVQKAFSCHGLRAGAGGLLAADLAGTLATDDDMRLRVKRGRADPGDQG